MHKRLGKFKAIVLPLILWWGAMFVVTTIPTSAVPHEALFGFDKLIHAFMYGGLTVLFVRYLLYCKGYSFTKSQWIGALMILLYGIFDELHQPLVGRIASVADYVADAVGVVFALLLLVFVKRLRA